MWGDRVVTNKSRHVTACPGFCILYRVSVINSQNLFLLCVDFPVAGSYIPYCTALIIIYYYSSHCSPKDMFIYSTELITLWY